jgi:cysteine desulfuration protein SufE
VDDYPKKLKEFLERISSIKDEDQRIEILVYYADKFRNPPEEIFRTPYSTACKVPFCESGVYAMTRMQKDNTPKFYFAIESPQGISAKALAVILDRTLSGQPVRQILNVNPDVVYKIFGKELSMGKNLGLSGMVLLIQNELKNLVENDPKKINLK